MDAETWYFETLTETEWSERFESFSEDALARLELFHELSSDVASRPFNTNPVKFSFGEKVILEHAGDDALRSMTMSFRQLWMDTEPAQFHKVMRTLREHVDESAAEGEATLAMLDEIGRRFRDARREVMMKHVWADDVMGEPKEQFRAGRVIDDWLNGGRFHSDPKKAERVKSWSPIAYEWSLIKSVNGVLGPILELDFVVGRILEGAAAPPGSLW